MNLKSTIFLFLFVQFNQGLNCSQCMQIQDNVFSWVTNHRSLFIKILKTIGYFFMTEDFADYYVENFAMSLVDNLMKFFNETNYFCSISLSACENTQYKIFDFDEYEQNIFKKFPPIDSNFPKSENSFKVLVINDIHVDKDYMIKSNSDCPTIGGCCNKRAGMTDDIEKQAGFWGSNYGMSKCDIPRYFLVNTLKNLKQMYDDKKFDFIVFLGDISTHGYFYEKDQRIIEENEYVYKKLVEYFPNILILPTLGNHETSPIESFDFQNPNFSTKYILPLYKMFIDEKKVNQYIEQGFYDYELEKYNLKVLSWNSSYIDLYNMSQRGQLNFTNDMVWQIGESLYQSEQKGQKVLIIQHIPFGDAFSDDDLAGKSLKILFKRFKNTIIGSMAGHSHFDCFNLLKDQQNQIYLKQFVSPSLTTFNVKGQSFRIYHFKDSQIYDYDQYRFDLEKYNKIAEQGELTFNFDLAYNFKNEYEIRNLNDDQDWQQLEYNLQNNLNFKKKFTLNFVASNNEIDYDNWKNTAECSRLEYFDDQFVCLLKNYEIDLSNLSIFVYKNLFVNYWLQNKQFLFFKFDFNFFLIMTSNSFFIELINSYLNYFDKSQHILALNCLLLLPNLIIFLLIKFSNITKHKNFEKIASVGIFLAIGILLGDLYIHILPHTMELVNHSVKSNHHHDHDNDHNHGHDHNAFQFEHKVSIIGFLCIFIFINKLSNQGHNHNKKQNKKKGKIDAKLLFFILADLLHNISDGIALGSVYAVSNLKRSQSRYNNDIISFYRRNISLNS